LIMRGQADKSRKTAPKKRTERSKRAGKAPRSRFAPLFQEGNIGNVRLKNRIVMPPMVRNYADDQGRVTDRYVAHIQRVAAGGVGAVILEASYVRQDGKGFANELGLHDDTVISGLAKLVEAAHGEGAAIGVQLYHGGRQASSVVSGFQPVAPSAIADPTVGEKPKPLSISDVKLLVSAFGDAADRAQRAGFDFVELHGAHGYLITQFLSSFSNKRHDRYGGSLENRMRFLVEVYEEVRRRVGPDFPVTVRLSADEFVEGGLKINDTVKISKRLKELGVAALHVSSSNYASYGQGNLIPPMAVDDAPLVDLAAKVKSAVRDLPVIAVAKIRRPELASDIIKRGKADFVAVGRSLLADPDWPDKAKENRVKDIRPCVACNQGCISRLFEQKDVRCTVNPETGFERKFTAKPSRKLNVVVVGAGPAGLTAAITAAERGHEVTLVEKEKKLGGQLAVAAAAPYRGDWEDYRKWLLRRVKQLPIQVRLGHAFSEERVREEVPDVVIMAVGSSSARPLIQGADLPHVVSARDLLNGTHEVTGPVVLAGGGCMGAQTAEYLLDKGHEVTIVESTSEVAVEAPVADRNLLLQRLEKKKVNVMTEMSVDAIDEAEVSVTDKNGKSRKVKAGTVVLCMGATPNDVLVADVEGIARKTLVVGDALEPRRVTEAVREAADAILDLNGNIFR